MSAIMVRWRRSSVGLFLACFLFALQDAASLIALPWRVMSLGGTALAVGSVGALSLGTYMAFCFLTGTKLGAIGARRLAMLSTFITCIILATMPRTSCVGVLLALVAAKGLVMSAYWPPIMGWVSAGIEGSSLNRRLGFFNLSWSVGGILGSWLGGALFARAYWLPFLVGAAAAFLAFLLISSLHEASDRPSAGTNELDILEDPPQLVLFRWIARVGFVAGYIALGALRVPIAALIKEMSLGAGLHATIVAGQSLIQVVIFYLLGRWTVWHYRYSVVAVGQLLLAAILIGVGLSRSGGELLCLALVATPAMTFAYSSHLYYCVSGGRQRRRNAALHEIVLSIGFTVGSFGGGAIAQFSGIRNTYFAAAGVMVAAMVIGAVIMRRNSSVPAGQASGIAGEAAGAH